MAKIIWAPQALEDIESIGNFIARDSELYARMFVTKVFELAENLAAFPESGRVVPELKRKEVREIIFGNYRIIYRIKMDVVDILTIYHSARLLDSEKIKDML